MAASFPLPCVKGARLPLVGAVAASANPRAGRRVGLGLAGVKSRLGLGVVELLAQALKTVPQIRGTPIPADAALDLLSDSL